jgi:mannose-6-phosphate isomerase-like protein (cupin superfamily)
MAVRRHDAAAVHERAGVVSRVLLPPGAADQKLMVTWVTVPPGASQAAHLHDRAEQVYVVIEGRGEVTIEGETQVIEPGDLAYFAPRTTHAITNVGAGRLVYVSATTPPESMAKYYDAPAT